MTWPNDADGDVFRNLEKEKFDFDKVYSIDVNIDFDHWPLTSNELQFIKLHFSEFEIVNPES